jgi:hypothetical protein
MSHKEVNHVDVLNLEWASFPSRDRQMATLVCNYLRFMGYNVIEASVFDGFSLLSRVNPRVFFICDTRGARINFELMKYARHKGCMGVSLISEGNFTEDAALTEQFVWGWNQDKIIYENIHMQWTERTRNLTLSLYPGLKSQIMVSGGVGFDVYKLAANQDRKTLLEKYGKGVYQKIIGVGCWDFGVFYPDDPRYDSVKSSYSGNDIERFIDDRKKFHDILASIIAENQDILFLLKEHPGCLGGRKASGIEELDIYPNVLIVKNQESIFDCIFISDFWLVYESTTALEAWLMGKETCLLNPSGTDFPRANVYLGSPNYMTSGMLQKSIDHYYAFGKLQGFDALESLRRQVIRETIQWDDGFNHVRAGNEIIDLIENQPAAPECKRVPLRYGIARGRQWVSWRLFPLLGFIPRFRIYRDRKKTFDPEQIEEFQRQRMAEQIAFYEKHHLKKEDLRRIRCL